MIATKLYLPRSRPGTLSRPRLLHLLDRGASARLTLISAPAGFGKTTLLAEWLDRQRRPGSSTQTVAWLSLDAGDNDAPTYWSNVIVALRTVAPDLGAGELALLEAADPPPIRALLTALLNDIAALPADVTLVLDDYHVIESREVHDAMAFLVENAPTRLRTVITTRTDPAMPLARLRVRGELVEVRATDLRFTPDEVAAYLEDAMGSALTPAQVSVLGERTEGWIAALQLAALSMRGRDDLTGFIRGFTGNDRYIVDYLVEEVLQRQPDHLKTFLLQTSILDRFTGALCDAVTQQHGGKADLEALDRANVFVVPLDDERRWYRYHHLFADVLRARLREERPDLVPLLHNRASAWHAEQGQRAEAIRHALLAKDFDRAAELIEREIPASRRDRREGTLLGWLQDLPDEVFRSRPVLSVGYAGTLLSTGTTDGVEQRLLDAERWLSTARDSVSSEMVVVDEEEFRRLPAWVAIYRAAQALFQGQALLTVAHAERALTLLDDRDPFASGAASALLGLASWGQGSLDAAYEAYATCSALFRGAGYLSDVMACAITLGDIQLTQGRLREAMSTYQRAMQLARQDADSRQAPMVRGAADMYVAMSAVHRERGDLRAAQQCLRSSSELGEHVGLPQNRYRWRVAMAAVREAEGDVDGALSLLEEAELAYVGDFAPEVRPVSALKTRLWVTSGQLDAAFAWASERELTVDDELSYLREFEHLTLARMLIARSAATGSEHDLAAATELLERLVEAADEGGRTGSVLEVLVLQAMAAQLSHELSRALVLLERAMTLAAPENYVRIFLDQGSAMTTLLHAAVSHRVKPDYARRILAAGQGQLPSSAVQLSMVEPLSDREHDVLHLLVTDLSGPDIARELVISLSTVRTHTRSIYAKLGATNRRAAVRRARELDLLRTSPRPR